jgi:sugar phosphate permease
MIAGINLQENTIQHSAMETKAAEETLRRPAPEGSQKAPEAGLFYGWKIVWTGIVGMILIYGIRHSFAVFFTPILEEFSWTRGSISIMMSLNVLVYGFLAPVAGTLAERWKVRILLPLGIGTLGAATAGCAYARELWHFYVLFGVLVPVGSVLAGWPIIAPAIMNWFIKKRGLVLGIGQMGGGLSFVYTIFVKYIILELGWRAAFLVLAGMLVCVLYPLYLLFFYYRPEDKGLKPYGSAEMAPATGEEKKMAGARIPIARDWTFSQIMRSSQLWLLVLSYALYWGVAGYLVLAHQVRFAEDAGYSSMFSVSIFALFGVTVFLGQMSGFLSDRVGREKAATMASALSIAALAALLFVRDTSHPWLLYVYSICFGYGGGLFTPTIFAGSADIFYGRYYGTVSGLLLTGMGVGAVFGPWLGGYIYDVSGSYRPAFILCIACIALSSLTFWIAAPRKGIKPLKKDNH